MKTLTLRTQLLTTLSALAPAAIIIHLLDYEEAIQQAKLKAESEGSIFIDLWGIEPGMILNAMLFVGCLSFLLAVISAILDLRRTRFDVTLNKPRESNSHDQGSYRLRGARIAFREAIPRQISAR